jgi:hypothetical protein
VEEERIASFNESMIEYRKQLETGTIQKAYQGLMDYMMSLRSNFEKKYPDYSVSGNLYLGYMDMTYFSFFPNSLKRQGLKVGVVFVHKTFAFLKSGCLGTIKASKQSIGNYSKKTAIIHTKSHLQ